MVLFPDDRLRRRTSGSRKGRVGTALLGIALVGAVGFSLVPSPYVIEQPGPVFNTLGTVTAGEKKVPMISIPTEKTYPTSGSLDLLTVYLSSSA